MTDKKLTDEEIIRRLERCVKRGNRNYDTDIVLDLINRQKAEIERLKKELTEYKLRLKMSECTVDETKSEAIKEFAEELEYFVLNEDIEVVEPKCKDYESYINGANQFRHQIKNGINNRVKEMTEVETNQRKEDEGKWKDEECPKCVYEYDGETMEHCAQGACPNFKTVEQIKAEAYKEFVNRLKNSNEFYNRIRAIGNVDKMDSVVNCVDNLLKEMVGDEE